jgi:ubiquinone/menaquinone biosynthesis C-methylase UbiE
MLSKAKQRGFKCKIPTRLEKMDIQTMDLADNQFDSIMSSFVFCTVPDPLQAMRECYRVLRPEGRLILLEHMNSDRSWLRWFIKKVSPLTVKTMGDHIDRDTYITAKEAGFTPDSVENLFLDLVRLIILKK